MNEIKCPKCKTVFTIDENDYQSIAKQIRDHEFEQELKNRENIWEKEKNQDIKIALNNLEKDLNNQLNNKNLEINRLHQELELTNKNLKHELENDFREQLTKKELLINELENKIKLQKSELLLQNQEIINNKDKEIEKLKNDLKNNQNEYVIKEKNLLNNFNEKIKVKDEQIAYYKDFKARQSTKMIGESLEVHCSSAFNSLRPLFKNAYFEKDNDIKSGSKGDFIFRDYDDEHQEFVSIMFEMKNEGDTTSTKHKNEDFFKELDKDRNEKHCEYAVLVSLLEMDNELYNNGIVDVSYKYPKMYVIRPQFFIPMITLIRSISMNTLKYKKELEIIRNQNIDISHFEENIDNFKNDFGRNYRLASDKFMKAIEEIDKSIDHLQKMKENLLLSDKNLRIANDKLDKLSIEKLTKNAESVKEMFKKEKDNEKERIN